MGKRNYSSSIGSRLNQSVCIFCCSSYSSSNNKFGNGLGFSLLSEERLILSKFYDKILSTVNNSEEGEGDPVNNGNDDSEEEEGGGGRGGRRKRLRSSRSSSKLRGLANTESRGGGNLTELELFSVCPKCLERVTNATVAEDKIYELEVQARSLQSQILKVLKEMQEEMGIFYEEMKGIEKVVTRLELKPKIKKDLGSGGGGDIAQIRNGISNVVSSLELYNEQFSKRVLGSSESKNPARVKSTGLGSIGTAVAGARRKPDCSNKVKNALISVKVKESCLKVTPSPNKTASRLKESPKVKIEPEEISAAASADLDLDLGLDFDDHWDAGMLDDNYFNDNDNSEINNDDDNDEDLIPPNNNDNDEESRDKDQGKAGSDDDYNPNEDSNDESDSDDDDDESPAANHTDSDSDKDWKDENKVQPKRQQRGRDRPKIHKDPNAKTKRKWTRSLVWPRIEPKYSREIDDSTWKKMSQWRRKIVRRVLKHGGKGYMKHELDPRANYIMEYDSSTGFLCISDVTDLVIDDEKEILSCSKCSFVTTTEEGRYKGPQCQADVQLFNHVLAYHLNAAACPKCSKQFLSFPAFIEHLYIHDKEEDLTCPYCPNKYVQKSTLRAHLETHTDIVEALKSIDTSGMTPSKKRLICIVIKHGGRNPEMDRDDIKFKNDPRLNYRLEYDKTTDTLKVGEITGIQILENDGDQRLKCSKCEYTASFKCYSWGLPIVMFQHILGVHLDALVCPTCGKKYAWWTGYKRHILAHRNPNRFGCDICGRRFALKVTLNAHIKTHGGEDEKGRYKCFICGRCFKTNEERNNHKLTKHKGNENMIACLYCNKEFGDKYINNHKAKCRRNFIKRGGNVKEIGFECELCKDFITLFYKNEFILKQHMFRAHGIGKEPDPKDFEESDLN